MVKTGVALALGAVLLAGAAVAEETPRRGGTLSYAIVTEPPTYDCHAANTYAVVHAIAPFYSTLLKFDLANYPNVVGDLADSWSVSPDQKIFTFKLHPNIRFHDGSALTSADVKATWDRLRAPPQGVYSIRQATFEDIEAIETPDPATVVFRFKDVNAAALSNFASPWNCVYAAAKLREDPNFPVKNVLGSGAFRFVEHVAGSHVTGERFAQYFREGRPYLDGFRAVFLTPTAMINALQGGQIQAEFRGVTPGERDRLKQTMGDGVRIEESSWVVNFLVAFNTEKPPFNDARVRRALSLAIDRWGGGQGLSRSTVLKSVGGVMRPGSPFAASDEEIQRYPGFGRDMAAARAEAKRLLKEAGVPNLSFALVNRTLNQPNIPAGVYVIDQWRQIGLTVEHRPLEQAAYNKALADGTFDAIIDFSNEFMDEPNMTLVKYLSLDRSPINSARFIDRDLDALYDKQKRITDVAQRKALIRQFEARLFDQSYSVPLLWWHRIMATNANLRGWRMSPSHLIGQDLAEVWLAQ